MLRAFTLLLLSGNFVFAGVGADLVSAGLQVAAISKLLPSKKPVTKDEIAGTCEIAGRGDVSLQAPCNGVEIVLIKEGVGEVARTTADGEGEFRFPNLSKGTYDLSVASPKFKLAKSVKVKAGQAYRLVVK